MNRTRISQRLRRLERRQGAKMFEECFVDATAWRWTRWGCVLPDGSRGAYVELPEQAASFEEWQDHVDRELVRRGTR